MRHLNRTIMFMLIILLVSTPAFAEIDEVTVPPEVDVPNIPTEVDIPDFEDVTGIVEEHPSEEDPSEEEPSEEEPSEEDPSEEDSSEEDPSEEEPSEEESSEEDSSNETPSYKDKSDDEDEIEDKTDELLDAINDEDTDIDEVVNNVKELTDDIEKELKRDDISFEEAKKSVDSIISVTDKLLQRDDMTIEKSLDKINELITKTVDKIFKLEDIDSEKAVELVDNMMKNNIAHIAKKDKDGSKKDDLEKVILDLVTKATETNGKIRNEKLQVESDEDKLDVILDSKDIEKTVKDMSDRISKIESSLNENGFEDLGKKLDRSIIVDLEDEAKDKKDVSLKLDKETLKAMKDNGMGLTLKSKKVTFNIPFDIADENESSGLKIESKDLKKETTEKIREKAKTVDPGFKPLDLGYDLDVDITDEKGESKVSKLKEKPTIRISFEDLGEVNAKKLGVYIYDEETGEFEFVRAKVDSENKVIEFKAPHFSIYTIMEYNKTFDDITNHWAKEDIEIMASKHIAKGDDNKFRPNDKISRAEFAALVVRALGLEKSDSNISFSDVSEGKWYYNEVIVAGGNGLITGYNGEFNPNGNITRESMATIISRVLSEDDSKVSSSKFIDEDEVSTWALDGIRLTADKGIINGIKLDDGTHKFNPKVYASRAEAIKVINNLINVLDY